jgi:glutamine amidotransferase
VVAESTCDSALLAQHIFAIGPAALAETVVDLSRRDPTARLNLLLTDGTRLLATTWGDTLSYRVYGDGYVVASEPYDDDPHWVDVPDRHLLDVTLNGINLTPLEP